MNSSMTESKRYSDPPRAGTTNDDTAPPPGVLERPAASRLPDRPFYTIPRPPIPGVTGWRIAPW